MRYFFVSLHKYIKIRNHISKYKMKKICLLSLAVLLAAMSAGAQSKINPRGRQILDLHRQGALEYAGDMGSVRQLPSRSAEYVADVIVESNSAALLDSLRSEGYDVQYITDDFSIVSMPLDQISTLAESPRVRTLSFGDTYEPAMDKARSQSNVTTVHSGIGIAYDGKGRYPFRGEGVIVGMFDNGFDPGHVNFYDDDLENSRLRYYLRYSGSNASATEYRGDACATAPTDDAGKNHGTHVAGIMGGSYNGPGNYKSSINKFGTDLGTVPLYGTAPAAELAIAAGPLYDANILAGVRRLIDYANSQGKPIAINLSLGSNYGPHDGTETTVRALDQLAAQAIICIASGNEGDINLHVGKTFTATDKQLKSLIYENKASGSACVWANNGETFTIGLAVINSTNGEILARVNCENGRSVTIGSASNTSSDNATFRDNFSGTMTISTGVDSYNHRYYATIKANGVTRKAGKGVLLAIVIDGPAGQRVDFYGNETFTFTPTMLTGFSAPDANGSISSMACGKNTIVVGAYNAHAQWFPIDGRSGYSYGNGYGTDAIAPYSSYGELVDGRCLPDFCAPGTCVFSSDNNSYVAGHMSEEADYLVAKAEFGGKTHYWCVMQGTSMACPYTTGVMGLWLQADPTLTGAKARQIAKATAKSDSYTTDEICWGAGKLNAHNGIKEVIRQMDPAGIEDVAVADRFYTVDVNDRTVTVDAPGASAVRAELYSLTGALVAAAQGSEVLALDASAATAGIYVLRVTANGRTDTLKLPIR